MEDQIFSEKQFMEALGIQPRDVEGLRRVGLPFIRAGRGKTLSSLGNLGLGQKKVGIGRG